MKSYFRKIAGLAIVLLLNNAVLAEGSFIEDEENFYRSAIERQLVASKADLINPDNHDKKSIKFALTVYGEYFGSFGILSSIDYYIYLKKLNLEETEEFKLVDKKIKSWGRKTALTILVNEKHFTGDNEKYATELAAVIEGAQRWDSLRIDPQYLKAASFWNEVSKLPPLGDVKQTSVSIEKVLITAESQGKLNLPLQNNVTIEGIGGRVEIKGGKLASCKMSSFTNINTEEIENAYFAGAIAADSGFGDELMAWRNDTEKGIVQILRGKKMEKARELYVLKSNGFQRSLMSGGIKNMSEEDLMILAMRGNFVVSDYARKVDYNDLGNLARYGSRMSASELQSIFKDHAEATKKYESILVMYANNLPSAPDKPEFEGYTDILTKFKND